MSARSGVADDVDKLITAAQKQALGPRRHRHSTRARLHRRLGGRGSDRPPHPFGLALTRRTPAPPPADAIAVAPATFNTVNKWAAGISDTLAVGILCEAYGLGIPIAVLPYLNTAQAAHPAYRQSLDRLHEMGVLIGSYDPHRPKAGGGADRFHWEEALELLAPGGVGAGVITAAGAGSLPGGRRRQRQGEQGRARYEEAGTWARGAGGVT